MSGRLGGVSSVGNVKDEGARLGVLHAMDSNQPLQVIGIEGNTKLRTGERSAPLGATPVEVWVEGAVSLQRLARVCNVSALFFGEPFAL